VKVPSNALNLFRQYNRIRRLTNMIPNFILIVTLNMKSIDNILLISF